VNWIGLLAIIAICEKAQVSEVPQVTPNFDSRVSLVEVDAQVIGKSGIIDGLHLQDFAVQDNRQPVTLRYCSHEETSLDIVLLFELSRFMKPKLEEMRIAVENALAELREGDRVAVMSFAKTTQLEFPLTGDLTALKPKIRSGLADATFAKEPGILAPAVTGAKYLAQFPEPHGRRVVLMFTGDVAVGFTGDNHVTEPRPLANSATASSVFWDADTALSAMVIPNKAARILRFDPLDVAVSHLDAIANFDDFVEDVAQQTGGEVVFAEKMPRIAATPNPNAALRQVIQRMRLRYRLFYDLPRGKPGQRRRVDVDLSQSARAEYPDARTIARKGYRIPGVHR
jgi:VWFA-related protein